MEYTVVWAGRGPLLPEREERWDPRYGSMPSYDIDDLDVGEVRKKRSYNKTGAHKGKFSRTNPAAAQFKPSGGKA